MKTKMVSRCVVKVAAKIRFVFDAATNTHTHTQTGHERVACVWWPYYERYGLRCAGKQVPELLGSKKSAEKRNKDHPSGVRCDFPTYVLVCVCVCKITSRKKSHSSKRGQLFSVQRWERDLLDSAWSRPLS